MPNTVERAGTLAQFTKLMDELMRSGVKRANFQAWEIEILLDLDRSAPQGPAKMRAMREYLDAVQTDMEHGGTVPMLFSEFVRRRGTPDAERKPETRELHPPGKRTKRVS